MTIEFYKAGTLIPKSWYTLTFEEGNSLADYPDMKFQFIKDANVFEIGDKRYVQAVKPVKHHGKARDKFDVIAMTGLEGAHGHLHFSCVMLRHEQNMLAVVWGNLNKKLNPILIAIRANYSKPQLRAA